VKKKEQRIQILEQKTLQEGFWNDPSQAKVISQELENLRKLLNRFNELERGLSDMNDLIELTETREDEAHTQQTLLYLQKEMQYFDNLTLFSGKYDNHNAFLTLQSGAGGVDAQDWTEMLLRMYLRWCERNEFEAHIVDESRGNEAGIKSVTAEIRGMYVYGRLKHEMGTHRLVRLSPFNSDQLRQTSFARAEVLPIIEDSEEISIDEKDIRIDTYRASGAGGQHVNKTDSAVRLTHEPTGIVVACQSERSQMQNKEQAMRLLFAKLHQKHIEEKHKETQELRGEDTSAEWGSQIRSYVLHPYALVKDHRTGEESPQTKDVLDGDIDRFIEAMMRRRER
jgi:peptide chain release factor 2